MKQNRTPIKEVLESLRHNHVIPFDVPGHKRGKGSRNLTDFLGEKCLSIDVNSMKPLDNLCHPISVIKEAEGLAAEAFGAAHAFFMIGGTTSAVQAMILSVCKRGDKIILPRNVHQSVLNALVLCGAIPVYIECQISEQLGIALGSSLEKVEKAITEHPEAKAVLVNNPTYYGICSDISGITKLAHRHGMKVLADEAHGTHFYFGDKLPTAAISAGADMAAISMHKSGGSLTQSSFLLCSDKMNVNYVRQVINLSQTTSASYILLSSLDIARSHLALNGKAIFADVLNLVEYARGEINKMDGYYAFSQELIDGRGVYDFDKTKLSVNTLGIGLAGIEVYDILRDKYDIQIEFGDIGNILAYVSIGDNHKNIEMLIGALSEVKRKYSKPGINIMKQEYIDPIVKAAPQEAFYAPKQMIPLEQSADRICAEFIMCYPPGIPVIAPGEEITPQIVNYIMYAKEKGCTLTGPEDMTIEYVNVLE